MNRTRNQRAAAHRGLEETTVHCSSADEPDPARVVGNPVQPTVMREYPEMSIFGTILSKIMGHSQAAQPAATPPAEAAAQGGSPPPPGAHDDAASAGQPAAMQNVDVAAI